MPVNARTLGLFVILITIGLIPRSIPGLTKKPAESTAWPVVMWLVLPPSFLYAYSWVAHPIFGPSRYNVFVAPAFLLLTAHGLARMPWLAQLFLGSSLPFWMLSNSVQVALPQGTKANWQSVARFLDDDNAPVVVISPSPGRNFEVEVARYYLGNDRAIIPMPGPDVDSIIPVLGPTPGIVYFSASMREGNPVGAIPDELLHESRYVTYFSFRSIRLFRIRMGPKKP